MRRTTYLLPALLMLMIALNVDAQTACPSGVAPGSAQCGPSNSYAEPPPSTPLGEWINRFGAMATDIDGAGNIGVAERKFSREEAENEAIAQCRSLGSRQCRVMFYYANQCASLAEPYRGDKPAGGLTSPGVGPDTAASSKNALARCSDKNQGASCKVVYSSCSKPDFRKY